MKDQMLGSQEIIDRFRQKQLEEFERVSWMERRRMNHQFAVDVFGMCVLIMACLIALAVILQYIRHRDLVVANGYVFHDPCIRCHSLAAQVPPPLNTYRAYKRYHRPTKADQTALLEELQR